MTAGYARGIAPDFSASYCAYRDVFGKPGTGAHASRLFGLAAVDLLGTIGIAWLIALATGWNAVVVALALVAVSVPIHRLFCVDTVLTGMVYGR